MTIPTIQTIEGQGGNISIFSQGVGGGGAGQMTIQVRNWQIRKTFINSDVTVTCSGGWREVKRVLAKWEFTADWPYDATTTRVGAYDGVQLINKVWVPVGLEYPIPAACVFQIGAAGSVTVPNTNAIQYKGNALISSSGAQNPAVDIVRFTITGEGTGALIGPVPGMIS